MSGSGEMKTGPFLQRLRRRWRILGRRLASDTRGLAAMEAALTLPVLLLLMVAAADLTQVFSANRKTTLAANTIGDLISQKDDGQITEAELSGIYNIAKPILMPWTDDQFGIAVTAYSLDSAGNPEQKWSFSEGTITCGPPEDIEDKVRTVLSPGVDIIVTVSCMNIPAYSTLVFSRDAMHLKNFVFLRPRETDTITCSDCSS